MPPEREAGGDRRGHHRTPSRRSTIRGRRGRRRAIERQTELVLEQMKPCLETAGSSLDNVLKCSVYCTSIEKFASKQRW
jgi:enamine deaminase RidA (YjgF/YER057c/UK114 family)